MASFVMDVATADGTVAVGAPALVAGAAAGGDQFMQLHGLLREKARDANAIQEQRKEKHNLQTELRQERINNKQMSKKDMSDTAVLNTIKRMVSTSLQPPRSRSAASAPPSSAAAAAVAEPPEDNNFHF